MIEISGTIFGAPAMLIRLERLDLTEHYEKSYSVHVAVRDPDGDHFYQRNIRVSEEQNILGILQVAMDELPLDSQICKAGVWTPAQDKRPLELM